MQKSFQLVTVVALGIFFLVGCAAGSPVVDSSATAEVLPSVTPSKMAATETLPPTPADSGTPEPSATPTPEPITTILFTGVIVPARCVQAEVEKRGSADYIYEGVREILESADITIGVFNATMSDETEKMGCQRSWELTGSPENADALAAAGFDLMAVATNHIKDCGRTYCGDRSFLDTLYHLERVGIEYVGAGDDLLDALKPVVIEVNGIRFGFVSLGEVNERVFATDLTPGIAVLSQENIQYAVEAAKAVSDVVIVMPHSGPEDWPEVTPQQKYWARQSVAAGADLVVTNHAHIVQGYHYMGDVPVFYSLGNFVFDQIWARDHQQGAILKVVFYETKVVSFEFFPTIVEQDGTVSLAAGDEKEEILARIETLSQDLLD